MVPTRQLYFSRRALYRLDDGRTIPALGEGMEINAFYEVAEGDGARVGVLQCEVGGIYFHAPPAGHVGHLQRAARVPVGRAVSVEYSYEWEERAGGDAASRPT
jgi:hypothetical protein